MIGHLYWPPKDPDEFGDYSLDWTLQLLSVVDGVTVSDSIVTSEWELFLGENDSDVRLPLDSDDTISMDDNEVKPLKTTVWVRGGVAGKKYIFTNRVETEGGRTQEQSAILFVATK